MFSSSDLPSFSRPRPARRRGDSSLVASGRWPRAALGLGALALAVSCGGKAVVDGEPDQGEGGAGGGNAAGGSAVCVTPAPVGPVGICGGMPTDDGCYLESCDQSGQRWRATCSPTGCACEHHPSGKVCSCVGGNVSAFCGGTSRSCCPTPFP